MPSQSISRIDAGCVVIIVTIWNHPPSGHCYTMSIPHTLEYTCCWRGLAFSCLMARLLLVVVSEPLFNSQQELLHAMFIDGLYSVLITLRMKWHAMHKLLSKASTGHAESAIRNFYKSSYSHRSTLLSLRSFHTQKP